MTTADETPAPPTTEVCRYCGLPPADQLPDHACDIDCCTRHYVQWVHGWTVTGDHSESPDPEQQAQAAAMYAQPDAAPAPDGAGGAGPDVAAIRGRYEDAQPGRWPVQHAARKARESVADVPALLAEVERLTREYVAADREAGEHIEQIVDQNREIRKLTRERDEARAKTDGGEWKTEYRHRNKPGGEPGNWYAAGSLSATRWAVCAVNGCEQREVYHRGARPIEPAAADGDTT